MEDNKEVKESVSDLDLSENLDNTVKKKSKLNLIIFIVLVALLLVFLISVFYVAMTTKDEKHEFKKDSSKNGEYIVDADAFVNRVKYMREVSTYNKLFKSSNGGYIIYLKDVVDVVQNFKFDPYEGTYNFDKSYVLVKSGNYFIYLTSCKLDKEKKCDQKTLRSIGTPDKPLDVKKLDKNSVK